MFNAVRKRWRLSVCLILLVFVLSASPVFAQSEMVLQSDFEKGTEKWEARGERVSIKSDKEQAAGGTKSMKISGRSANWNGTQLNSTKILSASKAYKFTVSVKLAKGEAADEVKMTMQREDNQWDGVALTTANANEWTTFSGKFKYPGGDPYLLIYVEAARPNTSYYIDDFKIGSLVDDVPAQTGIDVPGDRSGTVEPQLIKKDQTRFDGFDEKIISLYARGMTTREIQGHRQALLRKFQQSQTVQNDQHGYADIGENR